MRVRDLAGPRPRTRRTAAVDRAPRASPTRARAPRRRRRRRRPRPAGCRWRCRRPWRPAGATIVLVVGGVVADVAGAVLLLDAADAVHQPGRAGDRPRAGERLGIAEVRPELRCRRRRCGSARWRTAPRCRAASSTSGSSHGSDAVGEVAVGEQDHRRAVLQRDAHRLDRGVEAVRGLYGGDDRQRRLAVAAVHREQQVGLLGLGRQAGRRAAALDVDDAAAAARG